MRLAPALLIPALLASGPALAQPALTPGAESLGGLLLRLLLVLGLIVGLAWLARQLAGRRRFGGQGLVIEGGLALGTRERLVVVQAGEARLLLGVTPGGISLLHRFEPGEGPALTEPAPAPAFAERLRALIGPEKGA